MADIEGLINGIHCEIEVKAPGKSPSDDQREWLVIIDNFGGIAFWTDSLSGAIEALHDRFRDRGWTWRQAWEV